MQNKGGYNMAKQIEYPTYADIYLATVTKNDAQFEEWFMTLPHFKNDDEAGKWVTISSRYYLGEDNWYDHVDTN